jgi:hypothetical protein
MHFGADAMNATDNDLEDLMASLSPDELNALVDEMASDPDDKHVPASVRNNYRCKKDPTGELNRDSLINHINQEGMNAPEKVSTTVNVIDKFYKRNNVRIYIFWKRILTLNVLNF